MRQSVAKAPVKVDWVFQPKPAPPRMVTFKNGQSINGDVAHAPWAETDGGNKILDVYCYGCDEYFISYHEYMWRHGLCKEKPKGVK